MKYDLHVFPGKLDDLHKKYSAQIIAMDHLNPMTDVQRTLDDCHYSLKASDKSHR